KRASMPKAGRTVRKLQETTGSTTRRSLNLPTFWNTAMPRPGVEESREYPTSSPPEIATYRSLRRKCGRSWREVVNVDLPGHHRRDDQHRAALRISRMGRCTAAP